jgi:hypothetical protein
MIDGRTICDNGLHASPNGAAIDIRLPWYRALPLSVVSIDEVAIDGEIMDRRNLSFELDGSRFHLDDMRSRTDVWWYVLDDARLHVQGRPIAAGEDHGVAVKMSVRPPYIGGFNLPVKSTKTLTAR